MSTGKSVAAIVLCASAVTSLGDEVLYRYEADVHPLDPSAGWLLGNACGEYCTERIEDGSVVLEWDHGDLVNYAYIVSPGSGDPPPLPPCGSSGGSGPTRNFGARRTRAMPAS